VTPVAVAVCPATPLLSPEVSVSPDGVGEVQAAARAAVAALVGAAPDRVVVVGEAPRLGPYDGTWDWSGFGLPARPDGGATRLPRGLAVGAWLLDDAGWKGRRDYLGVPVETTSAVCEEQGRGVTSSDGRVGLLVIADGSAKRSLKAPGHLDPRAEGFDAALAATLAAADVGAPRFRCSRRRRPERPGPARCCEPRRRTAWGGSWRPGSPPETS
jgi:hypothetical protein